MKQYIGEKLAYRCWRVILLDEVNPTDSERKVSTLTLRSMLVETIWVPYKKLDANCEHSSLLDCSCGIRAYKNLSSMSQYITSISTQNISSNGEDIILGEVSLWGRLLEHSKGWRAMYAYPKTIICPEDIHIEYESLACRVAANYGITVKFVDLKRLKLDVLNQ